VLWIASREMKDKSTLSKVKIGKGGDKLCGAASISHEDEE
jgi:hypothetical protein